VRGIPRAVPAPPPASTNPISTKCTARNPCPIARAAQAHANPRPTTQAQAVAAKSSSPPTRANPAQSSAPPPAPAAARRDTGVGGRSDRFSVSGSCERQRRWCTYAGLWCKRHKPNRPTVPAWRRAEISIHHHIAARICSAARRKVHGGKMTRTKSRRRFPSDGCSGPLGDPLVCAAFLDDGMIRVQLNQASSQRIESAGQGHGGGASSPSPLAGEGRGGGSTSRADSTSRVHKPHLDEMHGPQSLPYRPGRSTPHKPSPDD
jgi:hypothetical protein